MMEKKVEAIHKQFANIKTQIAPASNFIKEDKVIICLGGSCPSPSNFYAVPYAIWNDLEYLMKKIQHAYNLLMHGFLEFSYRDSVPNPKYLIPGLYVVVYFEKEFHRARILKIDTFEGETSYKVRLIDYGDIVTAKLSEILHLMKCFTAFPSAAFRCQFLVKNRQGQDGNQVQLKDVVKKDWTPSQDKAFRRIIYDRPLAIIPTEPVTKDGEVVWKAHLSVWHKKLPESESFSEFSHDEIESYLRNKVKKS